MQVQNIPFLYGKNTFCQLLLKNKISKSDEIDINSPVEIMKNAFLCIAGRNLSAIIIGKDDNPEIKQKRIWVKNQRTWKYHFGRKTRIWQKTKRARRNYFQTETWIWTKTKRAKWYYIKM